MKRSQLAINSVSTGGANLEERLAAYAAGGFKYVEYAMWHVTEYLSQGHTVEEAKQLQTKYGLQCIGGFMCDLQTFSPDAQRKENHDFIVEIAKTISELGGANMVVGTDGPADLSAYPDIQTDFAKTFAEVAARVQPYGINLLIEFNWGPNVKSLRTAAEISRRSGASNVGVLFDPAHYHCTPTKFDQLTPENIRTIKHIHVNDMRDKPGELSHCNDDRALPGQGILDLKAIYNRMEENGYNGLFSIEMFNQELWDMPPEKASKLMYESLLTLCED